MRSRRPFSPSASTFAYSFGPGPMTPAIKAIIIANVVTFVVAAIIGKDLVNAWFGVTPARVIGTLWIWQPVTYMFVHADVFHILFNMLALWMFGVELERMWGSRFFTKFYFVCGVGAALTQIVLSLVPFFSVPYNIPVVGASGAIYGVLAAFALYFPTRPIVLFFVFPVPAKYAVMIMGAIALYASSMTSSGVAHLTHLSGLAFGYFYLKGGRHLKGGRLHLISEIQYRFLKWRINRSRKRFDVYNGGRADDVDRRVH
jgi:membrane associated rhomboid family serine protease